MSCLTPQITDGDLPAQTFRALGTGATVIVLDPRTLVDAVALVNIELDEVDLACSRFRPDAEILRVATGFPVQVSPLLFAALDTAIEVALLTGGAVDPTVGRIVARLGYDRDFALIAEALAATSPTEETAIPASGWWSITLDPDELTASVPSDVVLDLGSSGKAFAADRAARRVADELGTGVLVNLGGDIAVAGPPPPNGWSIAIALDSQVLPSQGSCAISIGSGAIASSSTAVRRWRRGEREVHHIVDPRTGDVAPETWELVTVFAPTCVEANAASTAAIVWGGEAPDRLEGLGYPARLVTPAGETTFVCGWPPDGTL